MRTVRKVITIFGSSRPSEGDADYAEARALGRALAERGLAVCTGGYGGVMEAASRGAREAGGQAVAVTAEFFRAPANRWVTEEIRVHTWQERLFELVRRGAGYVACKGGTGTLVELAVVWEMLNKGVLEPRPFVVLGSFWGPVLERVREVEAAGDSSEQPAAAAGREPRAPVVGERDPRRAAWREAGERLIHLAPTPADAAEHLARRLL